MLRSRDFEGTIEISTDQLKESPHKWVARMNRAIAYDRLAGRPIDPPNGYRTGVRQWNPIEDVRALIDYRRDGELTVPRWVRSVARRQHFPMMRADDPMPTVASLGTKLRRAVRKLARSR